VLECDVERTELLAEEAQLLSELDMVGANAGACNNASARLLAVNNRLQEIGAEQAVAKAASILAGLSFDTDMQQRSTRTFSGGAQSEHTLLQRNTGHSTC
jgi:ATPase subunit of ABC transporter with duplicated ATPase domains